MAFGIAPSLLFLQEKGLPPEVGSVSGLRCTGEDVGSGEGRTKLVLTGRSVVSVEPEKGSDTKRASLLKATERTCNPLHRIASSDRERSVKCSALLPGRGGESPAAHSGLLRQRPLSLLCSTNLSPAHTGASVSSLPPPFYPKFQIYGDLSHAGGAAWKGKRLWQSHMSRCPSGHFNDFHAA